MEENNTNTHEEDKQHSSLRFLSIWYKVLLPCFLLVSFLIVINSLSLILSIVLAVPLIMTFILGIKSLLQVKRSPILKDNGYIIAGVIVPILIVSSIIISRLAIDRVFDRYFTYDSTRISILGSSIKDYAKIHNN